MNNTVFVLKETDVWGNYSSQVPLGVFSSYEKAWDAVVANYGEIEEYCSGRNELDPVKNPNDVKLFITEVELDKFEEIS